MDELEARIRRLEDRDAIQDLAVRYGFYVDDHDVDGIRSLFAPDGSLRTAAGRSKGDDVDGVIEYFVDHLPELGPTNHFVHGHVIDFDEIDPDRATGLVSGHGEVWRNETPMITALRYTDTYRRVDGHWKFEDRIQSYMYFVDVREYAEAFGSKLRNRATPSNPQPADWPPDFSA